MLIDTVWLPYDKEFVANLKDEIDLQKIDYIVINHGEIDHSGGAAGADARDSRYAHLLHQQRD